MALCDLTKALSLATFTLDCSVVQFQRDTADLAALDTGTPHAGAHALDDQVAFKLGDGADDDDKGAAQRAA
jgi:hypothetical protein